MTRGTWNRVVARALWVGLLGGAMSLAVTEARAAPAVARVEIHAEERFLIEQLIVDEAITMAREHQLADPEQEKLHDQLEAKDRGATRRGGARGRQPGGACAGPHGA